MESVFFNLQRGVLALADTLFAGFAGHCCFEWPSGCALALNRPVWFRSAHGVFLEASIFGEQRLDRGSTWGVCVEMSGFEDQNDLNGQWA